MNTPFDPPLRQTKWDHVLRLVLLGGALFDLGFGLAVLIAWSRVLGIMGLPAPQVVEPFVKLAALLSLGIGAMIFAAALAPWRYHANINVAAVTRLANVLLLTWLVYTGSLPRNPGVIGMVVGELFLGLMHWIYARRLAEPASWFRYGRKEGYT